MIGGAIIVTISVILVIIVLRAKERIMALEDVLPDGRIVSHEEGVIEYRGVYYILGTHDLKKRYRMLRTLSDSALHSPCIVDMRFDSQIIIKKGPVDDRMWTGPGNHE